VNTDTVAWIMVCAALLIVIAVLTARLRAKSRIRVAEEADVLNQVASDLAKLERDKRRAEEILERMAEGVLVVDETLRPVLANRAARSLLGLQQVSLPTELPTDDVASVARRAFSEDSGAEQTVEQWWPAKRSLRVRATPLADRHGVVVVLQDITEELRTLRIRREFVSHASHELKSPVASLQALAEAVGQAAQDDPAAARRFSERLVVEADRLNRLISDLLDLSRLEHPAELTAETVDLSGCAHREIAPFKEAAATKGVNLSAEIEDDVWVRGDPQQIELIARNLLDNALRYTSQGAVSMRVARDGPDAVLEVSDTGMGIPLEAQERVFERFYRVDKARSRDRGGTGLGLAIVKHAVESHKGRVELVSELGHGSTFTVRLPAYTPQRKRLRRRRGDPVATRKG
jgi:two-component system, OmpR family, phosphate regulon sensor histidine kinase PhoR